MRAVSVVAGFFIALTSTAVAVRPGPHLLGNAVVQARLTLGAAAVAPGASTVATIRLVPRAGWHLYGPEHGDAGSPPGVTWQLPRGLRAGPTHFPPSARVVANRLTTFEYHGAVALTIPLYVAATAIPGRPLHVGADVTWLVCSTICAPGRTSLEVIVTVL